MPGIGGALNIARWSLYSSQLAIEVTAHNLANANTEGYSKQSLRLESNYPITMGPGQIGTGVRAAEIQRNYDQFINSQLVDKNSDYAFWSAQKNAMEEIEMIFNESDGHGLNNLMGQFWNAWSDVANSPDSLPERDALLAKTSNLTAAIKNIDYNLRSYQRHLDSTIRGGVDQTNSIINQIADLNAQISSVEVDGVINANDLRDRREQLLDELSQYMDINYYEEGQSGETMVFVLGGTPLVLGQDAYELTCDRNSTTGNTDIFWEDDSGRRVELDQDNLNGGKLAGWLTVRDTRVGDYLDSLNTFTEELVWQVNSGHSLGVGLKSVSSMTGTVEIGAVGDQLGASADFGFGDRYTAGDFEVVVYDGSGNESNSFTVSLNAGATVQNLMDGFNAAGTNMNAVLDADGHLQIGTTAANHTFAVKPPAAGTATDALAVVGVNTFFSWNDDLSASDMTETLDLNAAVKADGELVSAGVIGDDHRIAPGDKQIAQSMFALQDKVVTMEGNNTTMDAYYSSLVSEVGVHVQNAQMNEKFNDTLKGQYLQRKESVSGVNLDEEMANLIMFQQSYQAAAKLISISDEMLQTLLSTK